MLLFLYPSCIYSSYELYCMFTILAGEASGTVGMNSEYVIKIVSTYPVI